MYIFDLGLVCYQSKVAVWALLQGSTFFFLGLVCFLENLAATRKLIALRDQLRTLLLLTVLFFIAWMIAGNAWWVCFLIMISVKFFKLYDLAIRIIGEESGFGVVPDDCKNGNMGNRNLYHFCLAILIFLDISVPITVLAILFATTNSKEKSVLNKTLGSANVPATTNSMAVDPASTQSQDTQIEVNPPDSSTACCTTAMSLGSFVFGLCMFITFVTIAGVLGQASTAFCEGYVSSNKQPIPLLTELLTRHFCSGRPIQNINSPDT